MKKLTFIVIGGAPRSGTTLVQNILDSHPLVYGGPEFGKLPEIINLKRSIHLDIEVGTISNYLTQKEINESIKQLIVNLFTPVAIKKNVSIISEKTPKNALYLNEILELLPTSIGIHVVRDPRAVLVSMKKVRKRYKERGMSLPKRIFSLPDMAHTIAIHFINGLQDLELYKERSLVIRYEDLILNSEKTIRQLCKTTNLNFCSTMLDPKNFKHEAEELVKKGTPWYSWEEFHRNPDSSRLLAWQKEITNEDIQELKNAFRGNIKYINKMGYTFD